MKLPKGLNFIETIVGDNHIAVGKLNNTEIYKRVDNCITLNTDGFRTKHTKKCMNLLLPHGYRVFQKDFDWYLATNSEAMPFKDGMELYI